MQKRGWLRDGGGGKVLWDTRGSGMEEKQRVECKITESTRKTQHIWVWSEPIKQPSYAFGVLLPERWDHKYYDACLIGKLFSERWKELSLDDEYFLLPIPPQWRKKGWNSSKNY